ncbi:MAG: hypothetical protein ACOX7F_00895 [Eubacteriales bacterium]
MQDLAVPQEERLFQRLCYSIAREQHGTVLSFDMDLAAKNFYFVQMEIAYKNLYILENAYHPWVAFAKTIEFGDIEFMEAPFPLAAPDIHLLALSELQQDGSHLVGNLDKAEIEQITYWRPRTLGEIVFNFWD